MCLRTRTTRDDGSRSFREWLTGHYISVICGGGGGTNCSVPRQARRGLATTVTTQQNVVKAFCESLDGLNITSSGSQQFRGPPDQATRRPDDQTLRQEGSAVCCVKEEAIHKKRICFCAPAIPSASRSLGPCSLIQSLPPHHTTHQHHDSQVKEGAGAECTWL